MGTTERERTAQLQPRQNWGVLNSAFRQTAKGQVGEKASVAWQPSCSHCQVRTAPISLWTEGRACWITALLHLVWIALETQGKQSWYVGTKGWQREPDTSLILLQFLTFLEKDLLHSCFTLVITPKSTFQVLALSPLESVNILNAQHLWQQSHRSTTLLRGTRTLQLLEQRIWLHLPKAQTQTLFRSLLLPTKCF